jgi:hypothetical protein
VSLRHLRAHPKGHTSRRRDRSGGGAPWLAQRSVAGISSSPAAP